MLLGFDLRGKESLVGMFETAFYNRRFSSGSKFLLDRVWLLKHEPGCQPRSCPSLPIRPPIHRRPRPVTQVPCQLSHSVCLSFSTLCPPFWLSSPCAALYRRARLPPYRIDVYVYARPGRAIWIDACDACDREAPGISIFVEWLNPWLGCRVSLLVKLCV